MMKQEEAYLKQVTRTIGEKIAVLESSVDRNEHQYKQLKKYTVDYKHELDKYEVYNFQQNLTYIDKRSSLETEIIKKLRYQQETPYFAKILFRFDDEEEEEPFYIGRYGFADTVGNQLVYDWRAPISALYYDFHLGKGSYESLGKTFSGMIVGKRQYDIVRGTIQLMIDTDESMHDAFLLQELEKQTSEQMKTIIHTIQKEQNEVIRDQSSKQLIIQGVAGSGKTSIALHRIAYLLYQRRDSLSAESVLIVSPNRIFSNFIATVLPELGESELQQMDSRKLGCLFIDEELVVADQQAEFDELAQNPTSKGSRNFQLKQSIHFFEEAQAYLRGIRKQLYAAEIVTASQCISKAELKEAFDRYAQQPILIAIQEVSRELSSTPTRKSQPIILKKEIHRQLKKRLPAATTLKCYQAFLQTLPAFDGDLPNVTNLAYRDLYPYLLFKLTLEGIKPNKQIKHLVIDEMQDYSILQFYVLQQLIPAEKTICGDMNQNLVEESSSFLQELQRQLPDSQTVYFNKSYRSSYEIIAFAKQFSSNLHLEAVHRHGHDVEVCHVADSMEQLVLLKEALNSFQTSSHQTCGIICQDNRMVKRLAALLKQWPVTRLDNTTNYFGTGIMLTTVAYAKGLEFDMVILPDIQASQLQQTSNRLYTSCTRALHELTVLVMA